MARVWLRHERVRDLVDRKLVPLFFTAGSVNALCDMLNESISELHLKGTVYPNRLHSLLSDDDEHALNEATVSLIERAVEGVSPSGVELERRAAAGLAELQQRVQERWRSATPSAAVLLDVARDLTLPPAIVRHVLTRSGLAPPAPARRTTAATPAFVDLPRAAATAPSRQEPDWSFQDTACQRCLDALAAGRGRKVGLVLPTGAGKTRVALRIALSSLARHPSVSGSVVWVTHRRNLRTQAHRELQKMLTDEVPDLPGEAAALLAQRIDFIMLSELAGRLTDPAALPVLVIIDEAHHAAAPSSAPLFDTPGPVSALFLTATPNRTDGLPIGIDEIAYTITYRELAERGVIVLPEFRDFPVDDFNWSEASVQNLADYVIDHAAREYTKTLVLAPRIDRVEEFHTALIERLAEVLGEEPNHPLSVEDIGFVHSKSNSLHCNTEEFLATFLAKPRAIIVSAQLLLEGFDDPAIDTVIVTYPSSSMIVLMQAAGRCVRSAPGKATAYVVQARNDALAYHFDHRWLYQEISDYLRPELIDAGYRDHTELLTSVQATLEQHRVPSAVRQRLLERVAAVAPGGLCRLLLMGLPYYGSRERFATDAAWGAVLETGANSATFRHIFNESSSQGATLSDPTDLLVHHGGPYGIARDLAEGSEWRTYMDMLTSMFRAAQEVYGSTATFKDQDHRAYQPYRSTTWLKYVTFHYRPSVPAALDAFLQDCYNRENILAVYQQAAARYPLLIKIPLPLSGFEAHLLDTEAAAWFQTTVDHLRSVLQTTPAPERCSTLDAERTRMPAVPVPPRVLARLERFLPTDEGAALSLRLTEENAGTEESADAAAGDGQTPVRNDDHTATE